MSTLIGIDFGTGCLRMAALRNDKPQALGDPLPVWQVAGFGQNLGVDLQLRTALADSTPVFVAGQPFSRQVLAVRVLQAARARAENILNQPVDGCVLCLPSRAGNLQRESMRQALKEAGFKISRLLNEPTAVALSQSRPADEDRTLLIFCLGAGGLDVNVAIRTPRGYTSLASGGSEQINGQQFTLRLADFLSDQIRLRTQSELPKNGLVRSRLLEEAERVKILLSSQEEVEVSLPHLVETATDAGVGAWLDFQMIIQREQFEELIAQPVMDSLNICQQLLTELHLAPANLRETWLAGGSCAIPALRKGMSEWLGKAPSLANEYAAAFGAALFTSTLEQPAVLPEQPAPEKAPAAAEPAAIKLSSDAETVSQVMAESDRLLKMGDYEGALQQLGTINLLLQKKRARVMYEQGLSRENGRDYTSAKQYYVVANRIDHGNEEYTEALQRLQRQEARKMYQTARELEKTGHLDKAINELKICVELDHGNYEYARSYAQCLAIAALRKREGVSKKTIDIYRLADISKQLQLAFSIAPDDPRLKRQVNAFRPYSKAIKRLQEMMKNRTKFPKDAQILALLIEACKIDPEDKFLADFLRDYTRLV